jgi:uncharacterized protein
LTPERKIGYLCALMSAPSSRDPGARIDPWGAVAAEQRFEGEAFASDLPRLSDALSDIGGVAEWPARFDLRLGQDSESRPVALGRVALTLCLVCQRCLGEVRIPLDVPIAVALARDESQEAGLPDHLDPVVVEEDGIRPLDLVEDELLLAMPQVPLHAEGDCEPLAREFSQGPAPAPSRVNPFAVLVGLHAPVADPDKGGKG